MIIRQSATGDSRAHVAVIGSGQWGQNLVRNFYELGALSMICDSDEIKLRPLTEQYPECATVTNYEDVLKDQSISAVAIATPAEMHGRLVADALKAGKHVLVEK